MLKRLSMLFVLMSTLLFLVPSYALVTCTATNARGYSFPPVTGPYHFAWTSAYNECISSSRFCTVYCGGATPPSYPLWRCTAQGPTGGTWNGTGSTQGAAMSAAMNTCYNDKPNAGPCTPLYNTCYMQ